MRLVNVGVGELIDRLTILDLKIEHCPTDGIAHFANERSAILTKLRTREATWPVVEWAFELAMVNGLLWHQEDLIRTARRQLADHPLGEDELRVVVKIAFRIQELNDHRASMVERINKLTGDHLGAEKVNA